MPSWKQITSKPAGAVPANLATRIIVILTAVLVAILIISVIAGGGRTEDEAPDPTADAAARGTLDPGIEQRLANQVEDQQRQHTARQRQSNQDAERAAVQRSRIALADAPPPGPGDRILMRLADQTTLPDDPDAGPWSPDLFAPEEADLRLQLHLESLERHNRSLRAAPVALSARNRPASILGSGSNSTNPPTVQDHLTNTLDSLVSIAAAQQAPAGVASPAEGPLGGTLDVPLPDSNSLPSYATPDQVVTPDDPPGSHRIYEGSLVETVLLTQLSGDYPSPVIALVAVPFYSGDRQTILIPRGSRFIGTAQAVRDQDQTRLAVGFHRLLFPDGGWAALRFQGLNQLGEGALKDQVNRHYLSTFLAAGGVGLLSGLAHAGANPYGGTAQVAQIGAGQSFSETGTQIMDRFLNRLPTVTIRAGHRMRVWFTADLLIPTQEPRP